MAVRTVTLTTEAYQALASLKEEGESFSSVVRRLTGSQVRLSNYVGAWKEAPPAALREVRGFLKASDGASWRDLGALARRRRAR